MSEKKSESGQTDSRDVTTESVVELLTSILNEVKTQVQSRTPTPLEGAALLAVEQFREIVAALALQGRPQPIIDLTADAPQGGSVTLRWSSTDAQTVSIDQEVGGIKTPLGDLTPAAGGSRSFSGSGTTRFTATARRFCASTADSVVVNLSP